MRGCSIRARAKWVNEGELPTKYFLKLEKQVQTNNVINKLLADGKEITDDSSILEEMRKFYNLYKSTKISHERIKQYFDTVKVPQKLTN